MRRRNPPLIFSAIVDCIGDDLQSSPDQPGTPPSALRLVHNVEDYLPPLKRGGACLRALRRLGVCGAGCIALFMTHSGSASHACAMAAFAIHSALKDSAPGKVTVAEVALQQGFVELGRFSQYYRALFGEYPSETLGLRGRRAAFAH
jgi:AraC family ethanolamine operon transcriptional activator